MCSARQLLSVIAALFASVTMASHSLGGEFRYTHVQGFTYEISFLAWTCLESPADRPELIFDLGDGTLDTVPRISIVDNPSGAGGCCGIRHSVYTTTHTYPGTGVYTISMDDQNRGSGIVNIPNSVAQSFCVQTILRIDPVAGPNNSMVFSNSPFSVVEVWSTLVHDPLALDSDGDSLSFELVTPRGLNCEAVIGYALPPTQPDGWTWMDPTTGSFHWHLPQLTGMHSIAIQAKEWRWVSGTLLLVGESTRDMLLCVSSLPTGMEEWSSTARTTVRPTLCEGPLWVRNPHHRVERMEVTDATGRQVHVFQALSGEHPVDMSHLRSGTYLLRDSEGRTARFIRP